MTRAPGLQSATTMHSKFDILDARIITVKTLSVLVDQYPMLQWLNEWKIQWITSVVGCQRMHYTYYRDQKLTNFCVSNTSEFHNEILYTKKIKALFWLRRMSRMYQKVMQWVETEWNGVFSKLPNFLVSHITVLFESIFVSN